MVSIKYASREVCCKIVYYGPGLSGKTTNLIYVHSKVPQNTRGKLISLATEADRTLYFDFLPINIGSINGFAAKFQLYTVPGQVYYNATRKLVLRGVDGVVFVADSQPDKMDENIESLSNLEENLIEYGYDINELPIVIQYNKCDLPGVLSSEQLNPLLNQKGRPFFVASATVGNGVFDTLKGIIKLVLDTAKNTASPGAKKAKIIEQPEQAEAVQEQVSHVPTAPQASSTQPTATASATMSAPADVAKDDSYRPYPGSMSQKIKQPIAEPSQPQQVSQDASIEQVKNKEQAELKPVTESEAKAPSMAPSVKTRKEKKRGFFKRLFGLK